MFHLDKKLKGDTHLIDELELCLVLLSKNALFPWIVLVPKVNDVSEIIDLSESERFKLMEEISLISNVVQKVYSPDKLNVAALGNQVSQLHVHIIARYKTDSSWPNPVWGNDEIEYSEKALRENIEVINSHIKRQVS